MVRRRPWSPWRRSYVALDVLAAGRARAAATATVLLALRVALLGVVLFALLRPMLLLKVAVPQQNFLGILLDDSRSMQIADEQGKPRSEFVHDAVRPPDSPLLKALGKRFVLRVFRFSSSAERLQSTGGSDLQRHGDAPRRRARSRARRAGGPAARRAS